MVKTPAAPLNKGKFFDALAQRRDFIRGRKNGK